MSLVPLRALWHGDDIRRLAGDQPGDVGGPAFQCGPALGHKFRSVVGAGDAGARAADVVDAKFDHVATDTKFAHAGDATSPQIVKLPPWSNLHFGIEASLDLRPTRYWRFAGGGKNQITVGGDADALDQIAR